MSPSIKELQQVEIEPDIFEEQLVEIQPAQYEEQTIEDPNGYEIEYVDITELLEDFEFYTKEQVDAEGVAETFLFVRNPPQVILEEEGADADL